jgi:hypothetical protein
MQKEYDFSKGVRGKFYRRGAHFRLPIYLSFNLQKRVEKLARKKRQEVGEMVNGLLQKEVDLIQKYI